MFPFLILHYLLFMYSQRSMLEKPLIRQLTEIGKVHFTVYLFFQDFLCD